MRKCLTCVLLILTFLRTGGSNSRIAVSQRWVNGDLIVTCDLLRKEDTVTQVNWERVWGHNRTKLGTFHPQYGTHIAPEHHGSVEIQGSPSHRTSSLVLLGAETQNCSQLCCVFNTFPSGSLEGCADSSSITSAAEAQESETTPADDERWWKFLLIGSMASLLIASLYLGWWCCVKRRKVFQVEHTFLTDPERDSEELTVEMPQTPPQQEHPEAFDPSKLYAKIQIDYYYGRLWKAYESTTRWAMGPQTAPRKIYYLLGEHLQPEKDKEELQQE